MQGYGGSADDPRIAAMQAAMPSPATSAPPAVADSSAKGVTSALYALADHTHASKTRRGRVTTATDGTVTWTFDTPFATGIIPLCFGVAETSAGVLDVINVQLEGTPTNTSAKFRVSRTQRTLVSLIGLTILSVPTTIGATIIHVVALEP